MYSEEDAKRDLYDAYYSLHLDEILGERIEDVKLGIESLGDWEKYDYPDEAWYEAKNGILDVYMWAPDYYRGTKFTVSYMACDAVKKNKKEPVIERKLLVDCTFLFFPWIYNILLFVLIGGIPAALFSFIGTIMFARMVPYIHGRIKIGQQRLREILKKLIFAYTEDQISAAIRHYDFISDRYSFILMINSIPLSVAALLSLYILLGIPFLGS